MLNRASVYLARTYLREKISYFVCVLARVCRAASPEIPRQNEKVVTAVAGGFICSETAYLDTQYLFVCQYLYCSKNATIVLFRTHGRSSLSLLQSVALREEGERVNREDPEAPEGREIE